MNTKGTLTVAAITAITVIILTGYIFLDKPLKIDDVGIETATYEVVNKSDIDSNTVEVSKDNTFQSDIANIQGDIPNGWYKIESKNVMQPVVGGNIILSMANSDSSCIMSYVQDVNKYIPKPWQQISHGERIFSKEWQIDSNWMAPPSAGITTYQNKRTPLNGEVRLGFLSRKHAAIVLFNPQGGTVQDSCSKDMDVLLKSLKTYINTKELTNESEGIIKMGTVGGDYDGSRRSVLKFSPFPTDNDEDLYAKWYGVAGSSGLESYKDIFVYKNKLIQISGDFQNEARIVQYDLLTLRATDIIAPNDNEYIISMYITGDTLYYLTTQFKSRFCLDKGPCMSALHKYDLSERSKETGRIVAGDIKADRILGYSLLDGVQGGHVVYLSGGYGDAGCATAYFNKYINMNGVGENTLVNMGNYSGCVGEGDGYKDLSGTYDSIKKMTGKMVDMSSEVEVLRGGILSPKFSDEKVRYGAKFIFQAR